MALSRNAHLVSLANIDDIRTCMLLAISACKVWTHRRAGRHPGTAISSVIAGTPLSSAPHLLTQMEGPRQQCNGSPTLPS